MNAPRYPNIVRAFCASPWAMLPEKLAAIGEILQVRVDGGRIAEEHVRAVQAAAAARRSAGAPTAGGSVAVIPVYGTITQRTNLFSSGGTSTEQVGAEFDAAMNNPQVAAIVLDVDSPGGSVSGVPELAAKVYAARDNGKRIIAVANTLMASAAYWIGSAADEVVASPSADVGSIGVYQVHLDASAYLADEGLKYSMISAGKYKVEGNPYEPLSDEARAAMQGQVDEWYSAFVGAVAKHRDVAASDVRSGYGEGRVLTAKQALAAGIVDRVATLDDVLAELTGGSKAGAKATKRAASALTSAPSSTPTAAGAADAAGSTPSLPSPTSPASEARSNTVSTENTAATEAAAEALRQTKLRQLAKLAGKDFDWLDAKIAGQQSVEDVQAELLGERQKAAQPVGSATAAASSVHSMIDRAADRSFASVGEQLHAVIQAGKPGGKFDPRLRRVAGTPSGMNESVGSEGGFYIEPQLLPDVIKPVFENDPIVSRVKQIPIGAGRQAIKYNVVDETSRQNGSRWGGMQMYWVAEADAATAKKPKLRQMQLEKKKIMGVGYLTEELMEDAPAAQSLLVEAFQSELGFMLGDGVFRGSGAGQMQGFLNSGAVVSQAIEGTQTIANTAQFISLNVTKMLSRVPAALWGDLIWLYNQELLPYLVNAVTGSNGSVPIFMAAGGLADRPSDTILGRPAFASELCEAVGTPGDLVLLAPSQYHMLGSGDARVAESVHVRFLYDESVLKITTRTDGAPVWRTSITPYKGAAPRSPFVTLAARA